MQIKYICASILTAFFFYACSDDSSSASEEAVEIVSPAVFVFGSDYTSGELRYLTEDNKISSAYLSFNQDAKIFAYEKFVFVLERFMADNIICIDRETILGEKEKAILFQVALDDASNPSDIVLNGNKAWVSLEGADSLLLLSTENGKILKSVKTSAFTTKGGLSPNMIDLEISGDTLFALMQRYATDSETYMTVFDNPGLVALYDVSDGVLLDTISLKTKNPTAMYYNKGNLYVSTLGVYNENYGTDADENRGIEKVSLKDKKSEMIVSGKDLNGGIYSFALDKENEIAYASVYKKYGNVPVAIVDLKTKKVDFIDGISDAEGSLAFAEGILYIGDRTYGNENLWRYRENTLEKVEQESEKDKILAPYSIAGI